MKFWCLFVLMALSFLSLPATAEEPYLGECRRDFETNIQLERSDYDASQTGKILYDRCVEPIGIQWQVFTGISPSNAQALPSGVVRATQQEAIDDAAAVVIDQYMAKLDWAGNGCAFCGPLSEAVAAAIDAAGPSTSTYCFRLTDSAGWPGPGQAWPNGPCYGTVTSPTTVSTFNWPQDLEVSVYNAQPLASLSPSYPDWALLYVRGNQSRMDFGQGVFVQKRPLCPSGWKPAWGRSATFGQELLGCYNPRQSDLVDSASGLDATSEGCAFGCNPVNLTTGAKLDYAEDYRNSSPYPIVWDRYYHSRAGSWTFGYERSLTELPVGSGGNQRVQMVRPDGIRLSFSKSAAPGSSWEPDMGANQSVLGKLETLLDGSGNPVGYAYKNLRDETEFYTLSGLLVSIEAREGWSVEMDYDTNDRLVGVDDSFGRHLTITRSTPNAQGIDWVVSVSDGSQTINYTQSMATGAGAADNRVLLDTVEYPDSTKTTYRYDEGLTSGRGLMTGILDTPLLHRWATYTYDDQDRVTSSRHDPDSYPNDPVDYSYNNWSGAATVSWSGGTSTNDGSAKTSGIAKSKGLTQECPVCGGSKLKDIDYDAKGNPTSFKNFEFAQTDRVYDTSRGLVTEQTEAVGTAEERTTQITWHTDFRLPLVVVEPTTVAGVSHTRTTTWTYNTRGQPLTKVVSTSSGEASRTWSWTYQNDSLLATAVAPGSRTTTYAWDVGNHGNLVSVTNPEGHATTYGNYTATGKPGLITDANGLQTKLTYDARDRIAKIERGTSGTHWETTEISYTHWGAVKRVDMPSGEWMETTYTGARHVFKQHKSDGYRYLATDAQGRPNNETFYDNGDNPVRGYYYDYDARGQVSSEMDGWGVLTGYQYDGEGRLTTRTDGLSHSQQWQYDALGRLTTWLDEASEAHTISYDPQDQPLSATDPEGVATQMAYNGFGEQVLLDSPNSGQSSFAYNANGELVSSTDARGVVQTISRDALGRPATIVFDDSAVSGSPSGFEAGTQTQTLVYDSCVNGVGRLCSITDPSGTTAYAYDLWGRTTEQSFTPAGKVFALEVAYIYDALGRRVATTYPTGRTLVASLSGDKIVSLNYDGTLVLDDVLYEPFNREVKGWAWGGGIGSVAFQRQQRIQVDGVDADKVYRYNMDDRGQVSGVYGFTDYMDTGLWTHDSRGRLTQANLASRPDVIDYAYDDGGNLTSKTQGSDVASMAYAAGAQRLTTHTPPGGIPATWTYDARGNLINDGAGQSFSYDAQNRMATAVGGGFTTQFAYNAQGQRMLKKRVSGGSGSDYFVYDDVGRLLGVYDETGTVREEFVWLDGFRPVMTARGTGPIYDVYRIVSDRQQIPIGVLDATGTRIWEWDGREPYGYQLPNQDKDGDSVYFTLNLRMPGQWFDTETGLYQNGFRDYDPKVGRYVQPDPVGLAGGWNEYAYVGSDPVEGADPFGLRDILIKGWDGHPGHVIATELNGAVILNQNPLSNPVYSENMKETYEYSVRNGGEPDWVFQVSLWDDEGFNKAVAEEITKDKWGLIGVGSNVTNCVLSVSRALNAGGVSVEADDPFKFGFKTPFGLKRSLTHEANRKNIYIPLPISARRIK